jgi:hypothetical protein
MISYGLEGSVIRGIFLKKRFYDIGTYPKVQKMIKKAE